MNCFNLRFFCRNEATRTPDPYVPNVVRYQLRYIPISFGCLSITGAKVMLFLICAKYFLIFLRCYNRKGATGFP